MVTIQITPQSAPSPPSWLGEVAAFAQVLTHVLKVNYLSHQMAITLAEKGFLEKTRKAEQGTPIPSG